VSFRPLFEDAPLFGASLDEMHVGPPLDAPCSLAENSSAARSEEHDRHEKIRRHCHVLKPIPARLKYVVHSGESRLRSFEHATA
jgi:hypothetical protein